MSDYNFSIPIKVRISDINYGNHVSYAYYLLFFQDARIAYLNNLGFAEFDIGGYGMIISEANCKYKKEILLGDEIQVKCKITKLKSVGFEMQYQIEKDGIICAEGMTMNLCFDYNEKKPVALPDSFVDKVKEFDGLG